MGKKLIYDKIYDKKKDLWRLMLSEDNFNKRDYKYLESNGLNRKDIAWLKRQK